MTKSPLKSYAPSQISPDPIGKLIADSRFSANRHKVYDCAAPATPHPISRKLIVSSAESLIARRRSDQARRLRKGLRAAAQSREQQGNVQRHSTTNLHRPDSQRICWNDEDR